MKLKTSNSFSNWFLAFMVMATLFLLFLSFGKKEVKYIEPPKFDQKTTLDVIQVTLNEKYFSKLEKKRNRALSKKVLETSDSDYVPAMVSYNGQNYKAEVRLKGDWTDHLKGIKWSFRVKLKGDKTILGMRKFSIHHPGTRGYLNEWLYQKAIKNENLIGLRYGFLEGAVHVKKENSSEFVNREVGIYAIEETFDKRTIESNKRKESVILKYSEDLWWEGVKKSIEVGSPSGLHWNNFNKSVKYPITVFSESKVLEDSVMLNNFKMGKELLRRTGKTISISQAFDAKKLAMQNALMNLFGAVHGNAIINLRFYYNPITSKLEPIAFDGNSGTRIRKYEHFNLASRGAKDTVYLKELAFALNKVSKPQYLNRLLSEQEEDLNNYTGTLKKEFDRELLAVQNFRYNQNIIRAELEKLQKEFNLSVLGDSSSTVSRISTPELPKWTNREMSLTKDAQKFDDGKAVYRLSRKKPQEPGYVSVGSIHADYGGNYRVGIIAKSGEIGNRFGLRLVTKYPNRVDAVFDLEKGKVLNVESTGNVNSDGAMIDSLGRGWYRCTVSLSQFNDGKFNIVLGPTNGTRKPAVWEAATGDRSDTYIVPSSLRVKEYFD